MTKRFLTVAAVTAMVLAFSQQMFGAIDEELRLSDGVGDVATIDVSNLGVVTVTCVSGTCSQITQASVGSKITSDGVDGTISITHATFGKAFTVSDTAVGSADSTLPTLMDLNQIDATSTVAGGTLASTFTDTGYSDLSSLLNVQDSITPDEHEDASTVTFNVYTDSNTSAVPATDLVSTNSLSGGSVGNGGVNVSNPNAPDGSLTSQAVLAFVANGSIQANVSIANASAVPEPASIVFLGTMILGLTAVIRKKQANRS